MRVEPYVARVAKSDQVVDLRQAAHPVRADVVDVQDYVNLISMSAAADAAAKAVTAKNVHPQLLAGSTIQAGLRNGVEWPQPQDRTWNTLNWFQHMGSELLDKGLLDDCVTADPQEDTEGLTVADDDAGLPDLLPECKHLVGMNHTGATQLPHDLGSFAHP
jgi:hypothetical protein